MINVDMHLYNYFTIDKTKNEYGQQVMPDKDAQPAGAIKMAIYTSSQSIQDNINYLGCNYIGLTTANVDDTYIIVFENERLKVQYVNTKGRFKQVYMVKL